MLRCIKRTAGLCAAAILFAMSVISCGPVARTATGTASCKAVQAGDTVLFSYRQPVKLFECNSPISATIEEITDSRCPKNVNCVWAGTAQVKLRFNNEFTLVLELGKKKEATYFDHSYAFTLADVTPYPEAGVQQDPAGGKVIVRIVRTD